MNRLITSTAIPARAVKIEALANMTASFESFCLASGIEALAEMMENDARTACGQRHARGKNRRAHRWGKTKGKKNQMLINVSTRKFKRSARLPEGEVPAPKGSGLSKSAASRRFVALSAADGA